jgi:hypothetical protein
MMNPSASARKSLVLLSDIASFAASLVGLLILYPSETQCLEPTTAPLANWSHPGTPVDDKALESRWLLAMQKLEDEGANIPDGKALVEQLKTRKSCQLPNPPRPVGQVPDKPANWPAFYEKHVGKTVAVLARYKCDRCNRWHLRDCGGLVLSPNGIIATNYHVMDHSDSGISAVGLPDGSIFPIAEVLAADPTADVAIVRVDTRGKPLPAPELRVDAPVGAPVALISTPGDAHYFLTTGIISRYGFWPYNGQRAERMDITADFARGSSGFPVYDAEGRAVGIVTSTTSFHADNQNGKKENVQMVFKHCVPMRSILRLIAGSLP